MTPAIESRDLTRVFPRAVALAGVSLAVVPGETRALLGPNGAGKTTLLRVATGQLAPTSGTMRILGLDTAGSPREVRKLIGLVPSGDRSFYLRISGLENLIFFGRLQGLVRRAATERAYEVLEQVGLAEAATRRVAAYSHGMQKRLSVARALLAQPRVLLVDEATHDLDPAGAQQVRELVRGLAREGIAVLWATQRLEEIRGFVDAVTVLHRGRSIFTGTVPELLRHATPRRWLVEVRNGGSGRRELEAKLQNALGLSATVRHASELGADHFLLALEEGIVLGHALALLATARVDVLACQQDEPEVEQAFLTLTRELAAQ